jgi:cbb3-type cytochrome oxidase subunit 3
MRSDKTPTARAVDRLTIATVVLYLFLLGLGAWVYVDSRNSRAALAREANRENASICALRHDLERRISSAHDFLQTHPNGIPGISAAVIQKGIHDQGRTLHALRFVHCPPEKVKP